MGIRPVPPMHILSKAEQLKRAGIGGKSLYDGFPSSLFHHLYYHPTNILVPLGATPTATPLVVISDGVKIWVAQGWPNDLFFHYF